MDLEKKIEIMHRNSILILFLSAIIALTSIGLLMSTTARFNTLEKAIVFINDESLSTLQNDVVNVNENVQIINDNLDILQNNLMLKLDETCMS